MGLWSGKAQSILLGRKKMRAKGKKREESRE
jgi:hypothetical protein